MYQASFVEVGVPSVGVLLARPKSKSRLRFELQACPPKMLPLDATQLSAVVIVLATIVLAQACILVYVLAKVFDWIALWDPYLREMWNSRAILRDVMHPGAYTHETQKPDDDPPPG